MNKLQTKYLSESTSKVYIKWLSYRIKISRLLLFTRDSNNDKHSNYYS